MASELRDLRCDYDAAISLVRIIHEILLMIFFCLIKLLKWRKLSHQRIIINVLGGDLLQDLFRRLLLIFVVIEYNRPVLRPDIVPLPVKRSWVVYGEEYPEYIFL